MKRIVAFVVLIAMCLTFCSCGSEDTENAGGFVSQLESIVSTVSDNPVKKLAGEWLIEFRPITYGSTIYADTLTLNEDMTYIYGKEKSGTWVLSDDGTELYLINPEQNIIEFEFKIFEEDGFTKILCCDELYVRSEDYEAAFNTKYVAIQMNSIEYGNYLGQLQFIGHTNNKWEGSFPSSFYMFESLPYKEGLVFAGHSENFKMKLSIERDKQLSHITCHSPFAFLTLDRTKGESLSYTVDLMLGKIYFIRSDYVENVYYDEYGNRYILQKAGCSYHDHTDRYWKFITDVNPEDFPM